MAAGARAQPRQRAREDEPRAPRRAGLIIRPRALAAPWAALVALAWTTAPGAAAPSPAGESPPAARADTFLALPGPRVTVLYAPGDELRADAYGEVLRGLPTLPGLPDSVPSGVRAYLAPDQATFDSLLGGRVPEWSAGVAIPSRKVLVLPAWRGNLTRPGEARRVLAHEWAHLGLHEWLAPLRVPHWFSEGYAEWVGGWDATQAWRLRVLLATGGAPPLDSLTFRWPSERAAADAAYMLSATVVEYLVEESGERGLELLFRRWRDVGSFEDALRATYGVSSEQLEEDWREWVKGRYGWLYVFTHSALFWLLLALGLLLMMRTRQRRNREKMARLRAWDPPEQPAYWMPPDATGGAEGTSARPVPARDGTAGATGGTGAVGSEIAGAGGDTAGAGDTAAGAGGRAPDGEDGGSVPGGDGTPSDPER